MASGGAPRPAKSRISAARVEEMLEIQVQDEGRHADRGRRTLPDDFTVLVE
jgi:hypothetical protein